MSLFFYLKCTTTDGSVNTIGDVEIIRQEPLDMSAPDLLHAVSTYTVRMYGRDLGTVQHRYGDGGWILTAKAMDVIRNGTVPLNAITAEEEVSAAERTLADAEQRLAAAREMQAERDRRESP